MTAIVIAMLVPLLLHRGQLFEKAEQIPADGTGEWQGRLQQGRQHLRDEHERVTARNSPGWHAAQQGSARGLLSYATPAPGGQALSPPPTAAPVPFMQHARAWSALPGDLRAQEYRALTEENTRPLSTVSPGSKQLKGRKGPVLALGLLGVVIVLGGLGFAALHLLLKLSLPLQVVADIPLSGGTNRFDYQYLDQASGLLYLTHSASDTVTIFDTVSRKVVADIPGIKDPHDVAVAADLGRVFVTSAADNLVAVIDARSHAIVARIPVGEAPDGLIYDPANQKLFVADEAGQNDAVIDARSERRIAEIPLGGDAGDVEYDALSHHILAVVETLNQLVTIDPVKIGRAHV